jgi:hypothetical protein
MDEARVRRLQAEHERLKNNPNITILGESPGGRPNVTEQFARSLADLTPTRRRLALAKACAQPWRDDPEAMPECYRRDLALAAYEAAREHAACCPAFDPDPMFVDDPEPISPLLLRQLAELSPTHRRMTLTSVLGHPWKGPSLRSGGTSLRADRLSGATPRAHPTGCSGSFSTDTQKTSTTASTGVLCPMTAVSRQTRAPVSSSRN